MAGEASTVAALVVTMMMTSLECSGSVLAGFAPYGSLTQSRGRVAYSPSA